MDIVLAFIGIAVFGIVLGTALALLATSYLIGNEVRRYQLTRGAGIEASDELRAAALTELHLQNIESAASGGLQDDASALAGERAAARAGVRQRASNDPGRAKTCSFCQRFRALGRKIVFAGNRKN